MKPGLDVELSAPARAIVFTAVIVALADAKLGAVTKVLIVEDDEVIAQGMAAHLAAEGFEPIVVAGASRGSRGSGTRTPTSACST